MYLVYLGRVFNLRVSNYSYEYLSTLLEREVRFITSKNSERLTDQLPP